MFDFGHQGFVIFDGAGEFVRNARVDMERLGLPDPSMSAHPAGGVVAGIAARTKLREPEPDLDAVPSRPVVLFALEEGGEGRVLHEAWDLPPVPVGEEQTLSLGGDQTVQLRMPRVRAFEPGLYVAVLPDGRIAVSDSVGYGVKLLDSSGTEVGRLSRPIDPILVTDGLQEQERIRRIDELAEQGGMQISFSGGGGGGGGDVSPEAVRRMMEERFADMLFAEVIPVIEAVAVDHAGRIWVQRSSGRPGVDGPTDVITPDELYLGTIPADGLRIPAAFGPGGLMARIETDEFDVPTLVVERLPADLN